MNDAEGWVATTPLAFVRLETTTAPPSRVSSGADGSGAVVLLHGWMCDHADMTPLQKLLAADHLTVSVDLRGHGASHTELDDFSIAALADDVAALCLDEKLSPAVIVGHSLGGAVAVELAVRHPDVVASVVMVDSPWTLVPPGPDFVAAAQLLRGNGFAPRRDRILAARREVIGADVELGGAGQAAAAESFISLMDWPGPARLAACERPVGALFSDSTWPTAQAALPAFPGLDAVNIKGTGHWIQLQAPVQVADYVNGFIARAAARSDGKVTS
jgi:pimeloyl-ACP methyl ester carboxylesterase